MIDIRIVRLTDRPDLRDTAAKWFHEKWEIPVEAYLESMDAALSGDPIQAWYLVLDKDRIIAGAGIIENDFHDRKDLCPNICAVYTEEAYRRRGIAGKLLNYIVEDARSRGISPIYLITNHIGFYERYGWEYFCEALDEGEETPSRIYIHR